MTPTQDGQIILNLPDLVKRSWKVSDLTQKLRTAGNDDKVQLNLLKDLAGIERGDEMPSTAAVASLAFLFLLVNIYESHLEYVYACVRV